MTNYRALAENLQKRRSIHEEVMRLTPIHHTRRPRPFRIGDNPTDDELRKHMMIELGRGFTVPLTPSRRRHIQTLFEDGHILIEMDVRFFKAGSRVVTLTAYLKKLCDGHHTLLDGVEVELVWSTHSLAGRISGCACQFLLDAETSERQTQFGLNVIQQGRDR